MCSYACYHPIISTVPFRLVRQSRVTDMAAENEIWLMSRITEALAELIYGHGNLIWLMCGKNGQFLVSNRENLPFQALVASGCLN